MRATIKSVLFLVCAQAVFVVRRRLGVAVFPHASALAVLSLTAAFGGALLAMLRHTTVRQQLSLKTAALAVLAGAAGLALAPALALASQDLAGPGAAAMTGYLAPIALILLAAACRWEPLDRVRLVAALAGFIAVAWLIAGSEVLRPMVENPRSLGLTALAALALAVFLGSARKLAQTASVDFAVAAVLLAGGVLGCCLAGAETSVETFSRLFSGGTPMLGALALVACASLAYALLFAGMGALSLGSVGASYLMAAPMTAAYMLLTKGALETPTEAGVVGAVAAFGVVLSRE